MESARRSSGMMLSILVFLGLAISSCRSTYVITGPRTWVAGEKNQICVNIPDEGSSGGAIEVGFKTDIYASSPVQHPSTTLEIKPGAYHECYEVDAPSVDSYAANLNLTGSIGGSEVNGSVQIDLRRSHNRTFIQTDKYLYQPGQQVQFRILTIYGRNALVSTEEYPEVWVTTPSKSRIAQWKNVDNSAGIVHLAFQLADEPEKGTYSINVKDAKRETSYRSFEVDEYVLPRFEVTVAAPTTILATDSKFTFRVCAKYTFGQPVKGTLTIEFSNRKQKKCSATQSQSVKITGCMDVEVSSHEMRVIDCNVYSISAKASVEEEGTGVTLNGTASTNVQRSEIKLNTFYADKYKKPNLPYFVEVQAMLHNDMPASELPLEVCAAGVCTKRTTDSDGFIRMTLVSKNSNRIVMSTLNCGAVMHSTSFTRNIEHYFSPSSSSLQIRAPKGKLKCISQEESNFSIDVMFSASDQPSAILNVQIISRGRVQWQFTKQVDLKSSPLPFDAEDVVDAQDEEEEEGGRPVVTGMLTIPVSLPPTASPTIKMLVWYKRSDGEVVADSAELQVEKCLPHKPNLKWSSEEGQPGNQESFTLTGEPNSVCSVGVVDKSTELLNPDPDPINLNEIFDYLDNFKVSRWAASQIDDGQYCLQKEFKALRAATDGPVLEIAPIFPGWYYTEYADSLHMFINSGLFVFSDLTLETRPCEKREFGYHHRTYGHMDMDYSRNEVTRLEGSIRAARTKFPETWLWNIAVLPATGVLTEEVILPDTITEWAGKAVCAHPEKGVGVTERASIITFTPFFADLTLPPSVKRSEILPVKISVFNYLKEPLPVTVTLFESPEYDVVEDEATGGKERHSCLGPQDKAVHTIKIRPLALGDVNLTVLAYTDTVSGANCGASHLDIHDKRDMLIKPIKVEAEGFLREVTQSKYVCAADEEDSSVEWQMVPPSPIVPDSERGWVNVVGDLVTLSLENLGSLIRMPYGCGEQNMINFAPNIFIMQYLTATKQNVPEAEEKLLRFMKAGYQRQLLYQRDGGSFSAFGKADDSGSTWLTAFVLKSFAQAQEFIYVDEVQLNETRQYLNRSQTDDDGCIIPEGKVFSKALKGGIEEKASSVSMTAYVLTSLLESGTDPESPIVRNTTRCLLRDSSRDPYTTALKAYALALAGLPEVEILLKQLTTLAVEDNGGIHWSLEEQYYRGNSLTVETAGYAILAMLTHDPSQHGLYARKVIKWITTQRNSRGGFYSTQDTVVALQAMAIYETLTSQGPLDLVATVTASFEHRFHVNEDNKLLQQQKTIPSFPTSVEVSVEGQGCVVMQAVLRYNIPEPEGSDAFSLSVESQNSPDRDCTRKRITACVSYLLPDEKSNMAVVEVNLISGFIPEKEDLKETVRRNSGSVKRYEVDGSKVSFYVDEFTADELCVSFRVIREVKVEDIKPGSVVVYDYYQPEFAVSESYTFPDVERC